VIAICTTEEGANQARQKGAFAAFSHTDRHLLKRLEKIAAERDIKAIFDDAGGKNLKKALDL